MTRAQHTGISRFAPLAFAAALGFAITVGAAHAQGARFRLSGSVTDGEGKAVAGAALIFESENGPPRTVKAGKGGAFAVPFFPAGSYVVKSEGADVFLKSVEIVVRDGTGLELQRARRDAHPVEGLPPLSFAPGTDVQLSFVAASAAERAQWKQAVAQGLAKDDLTRLSALYEAGDMDAVVALADEVLARDGQVGPAHYLRGVALLQEGRAAEAKSALELALELVPSQPGVRAALGAALLAEGREWEGIDDARSAAAYGRAATLFEEALVTESDPDARVRTNLALALDKAGRTEEAIATLEALIAERPDLLAAYFRLAQLLRAEGLGQRAVDVLARMPAAGSADAALAIYNVAVELYNEKNYELALSALEKAEQADPGVALVQRLRGYVLLAMGRRDEGAREIQGFLERAPDDPHAAQDRALLDGLKAR